MIYLITGASGSGKTACLEGLKEMMSEINWYDFDEVGVPENADKIWRHRTTEYWLQKVVENQAEKTDTAINGNVILGEVIACPSAPLIDGIYHILLDCQDVIRIDRLRKRATGQDTQDTLCWAAWQRMHAVDPQWRPDVIQDGGDAEMHWHRWQNWQRGDARWQTFVIDTSFLTIDQVCSAVSTAIRDHKLSLG